MDILLQLVLLVLGFGMLGKGADWFVEGAAGIASRFGISELVIGLTIVAMGTSAPEAAVSIAASFSGSAGITVGNIVGSNIMNILVILGITALVKPLPIEKPTLKIELPFVIFITALLYVFGKDGSLTITDGAIFLCLFVGYILRLYVNAKETLPIEEDDEHGNTLLHDLSWTLAGSVLILFGSNVTVDAAVAIAKFLGLSDRIIGLTIVALGTSLPELFTSVTAAYKGNVDIAIGNIVGSNIYNMLFIGGITSLIHPVPFDSSFRIDSLICIGTSILLWLLILVNRKKELSRFSGITMLCLYSAYLVWLLI